jgi:hypothetical protein
LVCLLLPGPFDNQIRQELLVNFNRLATQVGRQNLVVTGADIDEFHTQVLLRYALYLKGFDQDNIPVPALLVTDLAPTEVRVEDGEINAKILFFPLAQAYLRAGMLSDFLRQLCATLQDAESFEDLENLQAAKIAEKWGWVSRYFELKPNFFGLGVNINAILDDAMNRH